MIDTDKYEGYTEGEWDLHSMGNGWTIGQLRKIDRTLMQDAPLILEDYKRLLKNINEYVDEVEAFHKMLFKENEMKHKIPLCPENKDEPTKHNWTISDFVGHRCVDCGFHWGKPLYPPKWKGDDE